MRRTTFSAVRHALTWSAAAGALLTGCGKDRAAPPAAAGAAHASFAAGRSAAGISDVGLSSPETVLWDSAADVYLVSNVNGDPGADDGNGFISRIAPDGRVLALKWIEGGRGGVALNAPKGMALVGDSLFVADLGTVRVFSRRTGAPLGETTVPETTGLNGVTVGPDGHVWVTDLEENAVYRLDGGRAVETATGDELDGPNGIVPASDGAVVVASYGSGDVYRLAGGKRTPLATLPGGALDGLLRLPDGSLAVTSWDDDAVYRIDASGRVTTLLDDVRSPAQPGYDARRHRLLLPLFDQDELVFKTLP